MQERETTRAGERTVEDEEPTYFEDFDYKVRQAPLEQEANLGNKVGWAFTVCRSPLGLVVIGGNGVVEGQPAESSVAEGSGNVRRQ